MINYNFQLRQWEEIMKPKKNGGNYDRPRTSLQWHYTPEAVLFEFPSHLLDLKSSRWCVIINVELCRYLINLGVPVENISYISDCEGREVLAKNWGINDIKKIKRLGKKIYIRGQENMKKKFNASIYNSDFKDARQFRKIAEDLSSDFTVEISDTKSMMKHSDWDKVIDYRYMGPNVFKTAQITSVRTIRDLRINSKKKIRIHGFDSSIEITDIPSFVPGENVSDYKWADTIIKKGLKTYEAKIGKLYYQDAINIESGTPTIFTVSDIQPGDIPIKGWSGRAKLIPNNQLGDTKGLGSHKAVVSKTGSLKKIGEVKYAGPEWAVGFGTYFVEEDSKEEILKLIDYINSDKVKRFISVIKNATVVNSQAIWSLIPHHSEDAKWQ